MKKQTFRIVVGLLVLVSLGALNFRHAHEGYGVRLMDKAQAQTWLKVVTTLLTTFLPTSGDSGDDSKWLKGETKYPQEFDCTTVITYYYRTVHDYDEHGVLRTIEVIDGKKVVKCGVLIEEYLGSGVAKTPEIYGDPKVLRMNVQCTGYGLRCVPKIWTRKEACGNC